MLKIIKAFYGSREVTDLLNKNIINGKLIMENNNNVFGDPNPGILKKLTVDYEYNDVLKHTFVYENITLELPEEDGEISNNILLLTSCNRIKQMLLALTINSYIIKEKFSLIIADCSTPNVDVECGVGIHKKEDPYNSITFKNYCSDISLLEKYIKLIDNIEEYRVIHFSPRMDKQKGDATLITLGLSQAALLGKLKNVNNICLKLTGSCILTHNIFSKLSSILKEKDIFVINRSNYGNIYSTRIFACKPEKIIPLLINAGWYGWINQGKGIDIEYKLTNIVNENISDKIYKFNGNEINFILDGGLGQGPEYIRKRIESHINDNNIPIDNPIVKEFIDGGIW